MEIRYTASPGPLGTILTEVKLKISKKSKNKFLYIPLLYSGTSWIVVILIFSIFTDGDIRDDLVIYAVMTAYLIGFYILPVVILYVNHVSSLKAISLNIQGQSLQVIFRDKTHLIPNDVIRTDLTLANPKFYNRFDWTFWGHYGYYKIEFNDGTHLVLSNLIEDQILTVLESLDITKMRKFFPTLPDKN